MLLPGTEADFGSVAVDFVRREVTVGDRRTHLSRRDSTSWRCCSPRPAGSAPTTS
jgi:hypothetical protein